MYYTVMNISKSKSVIMFGECVSMTICLDVDIAKESPQDKSVRLGEDGFQVLLLKLIALSLAIKQLTITGRILPIPEPISVISLP